jgi:hypothetical protein
MPIAWTVVVMPVDVIVLHTAMTAAETIAADVHHLLPVPSPQVDATIAVPIRGLTAHVNASFVLL